MASLMIKEWELLEKFRDLNLTVTIEPDHLSINQLRIENDLRKQIIEGQKEDQLL